MSRVFASTELIEFCVPERPHITFKEGGHLLIELKDKSKSDRGQLLEDESKALIWATQVLGVSMEEVLLKRGIPVYRINYQDNGNWPFLKGEKPLLHIHIYGRSREETKQKFGNALYLPEPDDTYYDENEPIPDNILKEIYIRMREITEENLFSEYIPQYLRFNLDSSEESDEKKLLTAKIIVDNLISFEEVTSSLSTLGVSGLNMSSLSFLLDEIIREEGFSYSVIDESDFAGINHWTKASDIITSGIIKESIHSVSEELKETYKDVFLKIDQILGDYQ